MAKKLDFTFKLKAKAEETIYGITRLSSILIRKNKIHVSGKWSRFIPFSEFDYIKLNTENGIGLDTDGVIDIEYQVAEASEKVFNISGATGIEIGSDAFIVPSKMTSKVAFSKLVYLEINGTDIIGLIPQITTQPVRVDVTAPAPATFTVVADRAVSYQWQEAVGSDFEDMIGETGATLTIDPTEVIMDGNHYRVLVTNEHRTITSDEVELGVS